MQRRILASKDFYKSSGFYVIASGIASVANYALYPILAKVISPSDLGDVGVVATIIIQVSSVLLAFNIISIYLVGRESEHDVIGKLEIIQRGLVKLALLISALIVILLPYIKQWLSIDSYIPLIGLVFLLIATIPTVIWTGYLLGQKALPLVGVYNIVNSFAKLGGALLLALLGFGAGGAVFGILIGYVLSLLLLKYISPYRMPSIMSVIKQPVRSFNLEKIRFYIFEALGVSALMAIFYSLDIISAKALFMREAAGVYVGASTIAGSIYYLIMTLAWVILPHYSSKDAGHNRMLLIKAVAVALMVGLGLSSIFWLLGEPIIKLALGSAYIEIESILWKVGLSQAAIATTTMIAFSLLVLRLRGALTLALLIVLSTLISIYFSYRTYSGLANAMLIGEACGWLLFILIMGIRNFSRKAA